MISNAGFISNHTISNTIPDSIRAGTLTALSINGVLMSLIFRYYRKKKDIVHHKYLPFPKFIYTNRLNAGIVFFID
jgi:hypothetical protein